MNNTDNLNRNKSSLYFEYAKKRIESIDTLDQKVLKELLQAENYMNMIQEEELNKSDYSFLTSLNHYLAKAYENNYINASNIDDQLSLLHKAEECYIKAKNYAEILALGSYSYEDDKLGKIYFDLGVFYMTERFEKELSKLYLFMARKWFDERNLMNSVAECDKYIRLQC